MHVNRVKLAELMGVSMPAVTAWLEDGMPYVEGGGKGKPFVFETADCIEWWAENRACRRTSSGALPDGVEAYDEAERRKMVATADKAELELAKAAGIVVPIVDVAARVAEDNVRVRSRLLAIPNEVRVRVRGCIYGGREAEEGVVSAVENVILAAMDDIRA